MQTRLLTWTAAMVLLLAKMMLLMLPADVNGKVKRHYSHWREPGYTVSFGKFAGRHMCPPGSFVKGFRVKYEKAQGSRKDDTALNGIKFICNYRNGKYAGVVVTSKVGPWGKWNQLKWCRGFFNGISLKAESYQGSGDDTGANRIRMRCQWGRKYRIRESEGTNWGVWGSEGKCRRGYAICGINTMVEPRQGRGDDTALNRVRIYCCRV